MMPEGQEAPEPQPDPEEVEVEEEPQPQMIAEEVDAPQQDPEEAPPKPETNYRDMLMGIKQEKENWRRTRTRKK